MVYRAPVFAHFLPNQCQLFAYGLNAGIQAGNRCKQIGVFAAILEPSIAPDTNKCGPKCRSYICGQIGHC